VKVNSGRLAITLTQLVEGLWSGWVADPKTVSAGEAAAACHDLLDAFFPSR
jgi:TetR/AcrR family transcriptional repressor of bet genes